MQPITWTTQQRRLSELVPWDENPRYLPDESVERLEISLGEFGYSQLIEIEPDNTIIDGHQRADIMNLIDKFGTDALIEVRVASRKFTPEERRRYIILKHEGATGEWDLEKVASMFDGALDELAELGFHADLSGYMLDDESDDDEEFYSSKIETPIYKPSMAEQPELSQIYDDSRYKQLLERINDSELDENVKSFLRLAAARFVRFSFSMIAEYYAHATPTEQRLFEELALVIVDFDRAVEFGFVKLTKSLQELFEQDND